jgi:TIR domain
VTFFVEFVSDWRAIELKGLPITISRSPNTRHRLRSTTNSSHFDLRCCCKLKNCIYFPSTPAVRRVGLSVPIDDESYQVFISYAHADRAKAKNLCEVLRSKGLAVFMADESLRAGDFVPDMIDQAVHVARAFIVLLSNQSVESLWVAR